MDKRAEEVQNDKDFQEGLKCPRCGSHTLRAYDAFQGKAHMVCLTCHYEFSRDVWTNPQTSKVAEEAHKHTVGTRVQMTHPEFKGQRGSIVDYSGKHADLGEEQYEIQLDNGEKITNIPTSAFNRIKSAKVGNSDLPDSPSEFFIESMEYTAEGPEPVQWDENDTPNPYDPDPQDTRYDEPEDEDPSCPLCGGDSTRLGELGSREYHRCRNCGMDFALPNQKDVDQWSSQGEDPDNMFGQDKPGVLPTASIHKAAPGDTWRGWDSTSGDQISLVLQEDPNENLDSDWAGQESASGDQINLVRQSVTGALRQAARESSRLDTKGNKLEAGHVYLMSGKDYTVPDLIRILNLEDGRIEAAIASDVKGAFPIVIESSDESEYSFDPVEAEKHAKIARKQWSAKEMSELIDENPKGRARNMDKLKLEGTHYELKSSSDDDMDFLWGV